MPQVNFKQLFHRDKMTNWEYVQSQKIKVPGKRNVYEEQQLEHQALDKPISAGPRMIGIACMCVGLFIGCWLLISMAEWLVFNFAGVNEGTSSLIPTEDEFMSIGFETALWQFDSFKVMFSLLVTATVGSLVGYKWMMMLRSQNASRDMSDLNQHFDDQHVALPEEVQSKFDWFPDAGAHSSVQVSSMISHAMLANKGIKKIDQTEFYKEDTEDKYGDMWFKGEAKEDEDGNLIQIRKPMMDRKFAKALYKASGASWTDHRFYDATKIPYNKGNEDRDKLKGYDTVADLINGDWEFPEYEVQRPAGAYLVDTAPVNTMVLAITRAGKGQTVIEPTLDMWMREKRPNNMVINDPKGELLIKNYVPGLTRGFQIVQFNLINALKTDIYNPLALAADAAREGDFTQCSTYIENIANVFFPLDGSEDPVWPNAANNAFKRAAYGLIDYYLEEEREVRAQAELEGVDPKVVETKVDELWGHVTLYNCYQLFVQLSSKKRPNPLVKYSKMSAEEKSQIPTDELELEVKRGKLWEDQPNVDLLTLFFNATDKLPRNQMRTLVADTNNALRAMGGADKMLASVYGIAITAMSFFTDPTISTLTSGTLSQNVDLPGLSFPRRFGVRFQPDFIDRYNLVGLQAVWDGYADPKFKQNLGPLFHHEDIVKREGWAKCFIDGKFPEDKGYLKLRLQNPATGQRIYTFYFEFQKGYLTSMDGTKFVKDPVLGERQVKNGVLREMVKKGDHFEYGRITFSAQKPIVGSSGKPEMKEIMEPVISQMMVRYAEKPKMVFLVTPPHLMKYAKLILILLKQLVDLNFAQSYMTKANQKPLYKTRYMLDELGNLQSEGHGIQGLETMLSIGLGQDQQFTIILQTLQQLRNVYGDSSDKIIQGNAQPLSAKIVTPQGYVSMGNIKVGDEVVTPEGLKAQVKGVFPRGKRKVYKITRADGSSTLACNEHLWRVKIN